MYLSLLTDNTSNVEQKIQFLYFCKRLLRKTLGDNNKQFRNSSICTK